MCLSVFIVTIIIHHRHRGIISSVSSLQIPADLPPRACAIWPLTTRPLAPGTRETRPRGATCHATWGSSWWPTWCTGWASRPCSPWVPSTLTRTRSTPWPLSTWVSAGSLLFVVVFFCSLSRSCCVLSCNLPPAEWPFFYVPLQSGGGAGRGEGADCAVQA